MQIEFAKNWLRESTQEIVELKVINRQMMLGETAKYWKRAGREQVLVFFDKKEKRQRSSIEDVCGKPRKTESKLSAGFYIDNKGALGKRNTKTRNRTLAWMLIDWRRREKSLETENKLWPMVIKGRGREKTQGTESKQQWISKFLIEYKTNDREWRDHSKLWLDRERLESCFERSRCGLDGNHSFFLCKLIVQRFAEYGR